MLKNIIIMTSFGGGGQVAIDEALHEALHKQYHVKSTYYFSEVIQSADPIATVTRGRLSGEKLYNIGVKKKLFKSLNILSRLSHWYFTLFTQHLVKQTTQYLTTQKPDLVISIIPIVNNVLAQSCSALDIPLLIIPPDLDISFYIGNIQEKNHTHCHLGLPFDNPIARKILKESNFPADRIIPIKYPLRASFYKTKDIELIKQDFEVYDKRPSILLMMGAQGSSASYTFAKALTQIHVPAHIFICIGKNKSIKKQLETIQYPQFITPHIIEYTQRISDLMAIADILITKSGSLTVAEALYSKLPMLVDQTSTVLFWEYFNHTLIETYGYGKTIKKVKNIAAMATELLTNKVLYKEIKKNLERIERDKGKNIEELIAQVLE